MDSLGPSFIELHTIDDRQNIDANRFYTDLEDETWRRKILLR